MRTETMVMHDKTGAPTDDKAAAVSVEITRTFEDGTSERTLMRKTPSPASAA